MLSSAAINAVNQALRHAKWARNDFRAFPGKTFCVHIPPLIELKLQITAEGDIRAANTIGRTDAVLTVPPPLLPKLLARESGAFDAVKIAGNETLGKQLISVGKQIDLTTIVTHNLSSIVGDIPAYRIGQAGEWLLRWHTDTIARISRIAGEYLVEEKSWLIKDTPMRQFTAEVQTLRHSTEQLERKLKRMARRNALRSTA